MEHLCTDMVKTDGQQRSEEVKSIERGEGLCTVEDAQSNMKTVPDDAVLQRPQGSFSSPKTSYVVDPPTAMLLGLSITLLLLGLAIGYPGFAEWQRGAGIDREDLQPIIPPSYNPHLFTAVCCADDLPPQSISIQALPIIELRKSPSCDDVNNCRSISTIVWSCLITIFSCTWITVQSTIPESHSTPF